jgi:hypothetical protein
VIEEDLLAVLEPAMNNKGQDTPSSRRNRGVSLGVAFGECSLQTIVCVAFYCIAVLWMVCLMVLYSIARGGACEAIVCGSAVGEKRTVLKSSSANNTVTLFNHLLFVAVSRN